MPIHNTLILGIGNVLLSDEGIGIHMLGYMRDRYPDLPGVSYLDGGTLSFTLAPHIEEVDNLIVIDAAELDATPGTVEVFIGAAMDRFAGRTKSSVHEVSLGDLISIARLCDHLPENRALVAIQPQQVDWGSTPSAPVAAAMPEAAALAASLVTKWTPEAGRSGRQFASAV